MHRSGLLSDFLSSDLATQHGGLDIEQLFNLV